MGKKFTVYLSDELYSLAERVARRKKLTVSQLVSVALQYYIHEVAKRGKRS